MTTALICTGFHRSGTSLAAQILHRAGVSMGLDLMAGGISNPDGHFEDTRAVEIHDKLLRQNGTSWMFHRECCLAQPDGATASIRDYIQSRANLTPGVWGVKDPRLSLFLGHWHAALGGTGRFVVLFRNWALCLQSLYDRHSRHIAHHLLTGQRLSEHAQFWINPTLAAEMWLAYNRSLIDFCAQHRDITLVASQECLVNGFDLVGAINRRFSLDLPVPREPPGEAPVKPALYNNRADGTLTRHLSADLVRQLNSTCDEISALSECGGDPCNTSAVHVRNSTSSPKARRLYRELRSLATSREAPPPRDDTGLDLSAMTYDQLMDRLKSLRANHQLSDGALALPIVQHLAMLRPDDCRTHEWLGHVVFLADQDYRRAADHYRNAIASNNSAPAYLFVLLGNCHLAQGDSAEAESCFQVACSKNPNNAVAWMRLAAVSQREGRYPQAIGRLRLALDLDRTNATCQIALVDCLDKAGRREEAIALGTALWGDEHKAVLGERLANLKLVSGHVDGRQFYESVVKRGLIEQDIRQWLPHLAALAIEDGPLQQLADMLVKHWSMVMGDDMDAWLAGGPKDKSHDVPDAS
jgi:tetratricopeptide (TPR) repeat protein